MSERVSKEERRARVIDVLNQARAMELLPSPSI